MAQLLRQTKNLVVRPLDAADYEEWKTTWSTMKSPLNEWDRTNKNASDLTRGAFKIVLSSQSKMRKADLFYDLAVFEKRTGELVGTVSIMQVLRGITQSAFLGYSIFNAHWGRGFGKEATLAAIDIGFRDVKLHRMEAGVEPGNKRSIRLAKSIGMRREGVKRRAVFLRGKWVDLIVFAATSEDFGLKWKGALSPRKS